MEIENNINGIKELFNIQINSLILAESKISDHYLKAAELIANANKIILSGIGKSGLIARKLAATLSSYTISAVFLHPVEALHGDIGIVQEDDVIIMLSKSGNTEEIIRLIPYIKSRNAKIISIVSNVDSALAHHSDIVLDASITQEACLFGLAPTSSTTVSLVIGDVISVFAAKLKNITIKDLSKTHPLGSIGRQTLVKVKDVMHTGNKIPLVKPNDSLKNTIIEITDKGLGCAVVIDEQKKVKGFITDGDLRRALMKNEDLSALNASMIMTKNPITISPDEFLEQAISLMENRKSQINSLVVCNEDGEVVGVVRLHDIINDAM